MYAIFFIQISTFPSAFVTGIASHVYDSLYTLAIPDVTPAFDTLGMNTFSSLYVSALVPSVKSGVTVTSFTLKLSASYFTAFDIIITFSSSKRSYPDDTFSA